MPWCEGKGVGGLKMTIMCVYERALIRVALAWVNVSVGMHKCMGLYQ